MNGRKNESEYVKGVPKSSIYSTATANTFRLLVVCHEYGFWSDYVGYYKSRCPNDGGDGDDGGDGP